MFRFIIFLFLFPLYTIAQENPEIQDNASIVHHPNLIEELQQPGAKGGKILLSADRSIDNLLEIYTRQNQKKKTFTGYRIQIHSVSSYGCNINQLKDMRNKFEQTFPDMPAYLQYFDPDFKIRVGNFRSRLECISALHSIRKLYPSCYPVKTDITLEELKRIPMQDIPVVETQE